MDRAKIIEVLNKTVARANAKFGISINVPPTVVFVQTGRAAGRVWLDGTKIEFHEAVAKRVGDEFEDTIIHEVAHLVTKRVYPRAKQNHGPEFKMVDKMLGGRGTRCHSYDVSDFTNRRTKTRYAVKCDCKTHMVTKKYINAIIDGKRFTCQLCGTNVQITGEVKTFI